MAKKHTVPLCERRAEAAAFRALQWVRKYEKLKGKARSGSTSSRAYYRKQAAEAEKQVGIWMKISRQRRRSCR